MADFDAKKEKIKLKKIIKNIPPDKKKLVEGLVADASFMAEQLEMLRTHILVNGWSEEYKNGKDQWGRKTSVEADTYVKLQKNYQSVIKQLTEFLPDTKTELTAKAGEDFAAFVVKGKPPIELR